MCVLRFSSLPGLMAYGVRSHRIKARPTTRSIEGPAPDLRVPITMLSEQRPAGEKGSVPLTMVHDSGFDQDMRQDVEKNEFSQERNRSGEFMWPEMHEENQARSRSVAQPYGKYGERKERPTTIQRPLMGRPCGRARK